MSFTTERSRLAAAGLKAQEIYERDVDAHGRIAPAWHTLARHTRDIYIKLACIELDRDRVVRFPRPVPPTDIVPHAVRAIEAAIDDLVNAANAAQSEREAVDLQDVIKDLTVKLNAASNVAFHREQTFYPKGN